MNDIKKEDLIEGELYRTFNHQIGMNIYFKYLKHTNPYGNISYSNLITNYLNSFYKKGFHNVQQDPFYEVTSQEKHWLETCIKEDKFITFEETMKTFEEFVLPNRWCIKSNNNKELQKVLEFEPIKNCNDSRGLMFYRHFPLFAQNCTCNDGVKQGYTEITFEQFKKYVLKEVEVIEPLPQFKVIKTVETITEVENNEGSLFIIGDVITTCEGINKGNKFTIKDFRYNNPGDNICAITDGHGPYGIGIDKIEHFIEVKIVKEEPLLEKAKRLYPIGTKYKTYGVTQISNGLFEVTPRGVFLRTQLGWLVLNNVWAEIIPNHDFKVGDKIKSRFNDAKWEINEIKGNVLFLKNQPKWCNSVLAKNTIKIN